MNHESIRQQLPHLVTGHLPRNSHRFKYAIFDGAPKESMLGFSVDPQPFEGKVIAITDDAIVVKTKPTQFAVLDRKLVSTGMAEGDKIEVKPYARRRFDGIRADTPEEVEEQASDGTTYTVRRMILGSAPAPLPVPKPQCMELQQLIEQLETLPAPDGHRRISHMLVDARASNFALVDPEYDDIIRTPPTISFNVETGKFQGRVSVLYLRGSDTYAIELHQDEELVQRYDDVYFDDLGSVLADLIDDGSWRHIDVRLISGRRPTRQ